MIIDSPSKPEDLNSVEGLYYKKMEARDRTEVNEIECKYLDGPLSPEFINNCRRSI
jgi:hypothetical protein